MPKQADPISMPLTFIQCDISCSYLLSLEGSESRILIFFLCVLYYLVLILFCCKNFSLCFFSCVVLGLSIEEMQRVGFMRMLLTDSYFRVTSMLLSFGDLECSLGMLLPIDLLHVQVLWTSLISVLSFGLA